MISHRLRPFAWLLGFSVLVCGAVKAFAQLDPEKQKESDWVDTRWNKTELGNFHASTLPLTNGTIAKGLSVRIGDKGEAAVAYDTASATWRAGWTGGFLKFDGTRYGLLKPPQPAGEVQFLAPGIRPGYAKWLGLHVMGPRVVIEYEVAQTKIKESPWFETVDGFSAFTRTLELGPGGDVAMALIQARGRELGIARTNGVRLMTLKTNDNVWVMAITGDRAGQMTFENGILNVRFPERTETRRLKIFIASGSKADIPGIAALVKQSAAPEDLSALCKTNIAWWKPLTTRGQRGATSDGFAIDTLTVPYENPWNALLFTSGVDFLPNGDAAVCTIHGDVWLVSGIDDKLDRLTWRRFATGLFQPLGLRVRDGKIFVLGRDQITLLHDENGDGEADFYESFFNGIQTSTGGHEYVTSLEIDTNGNFYYVDPRGVHRVSADGRKRETLAAGFRNPNGMGVSPDGTIVTVAPQQGEWTPSSSICEIKPSGWYGYGGPRITNDRPLGYDAPLCWIPHSVDNSGGSQLWVTSEQWGPLKDHFLHFSFGRCAEFLVLREVVDGTPQGALVPLPGKFLSGVMRGAFNARDGQLYVVGTRGWQTSAARDGSLQRVRYTGDALPLPLPLEFHAHTNGIRLTFSTPLDHAAAEDSGSYAASHWNYHYEAKYGSKDYTPSNPGKEGRDPLEVKSAKLLADGRTVFLEVQALHPVMQFEIKYSLKSADGKSVRSQVHGTINRLGSKFAELPR